MLLDSGKAFTGGAAASEVEESTLRVVVKEAVEQANGDAQIATQYLEAAVRADRRLRDEVTETLIHEGCSRLVASVIRSTRSVVWAAPNRDPGGAARRIAAVANHGLMSFPLPGGKRLSDAVKSEVLDAAGFFDAQGKNMIGKGKWLKLVANALASEARVGDSLTEDQLQTMHRKVVGNA